VAKPGVTVTFKDTGLSALKMRMGQLNAFALSVGIQGRRGASPVLEEVTLNRGPGGRFSGGSTTTTLTTLADVALFNEFGTENIPARSFLRGALFQYKDQIELFIADKLGIFIADTRTTAMSTLTKIGKFVAGRVKVRINTPGLWAKPNAASTVKAKGFNRPLHGNTFGAGKLSNSITWAIRQGSGGPILKEGLAR